MLNLENYVPRPKATFSVTVFAPEVTEDTLKRLSLAMSDSLGNLSIAHGERIRADQLVVLIVVDREVSEQLWVKLYLAHASRVPEIASVVYKHDLRPHSSLWHAADFLETRDWADFFPTIIKAIHG